MAVRDKSIFVLELCLIHLPKKNEKNFWSKGVIKYDREKIKNAWNIGNYKFVVIHSNGSIFSTCVSGIRLAEYGDQ